jgi:hypothetical protein
MPIDERMKLKSGELSTWVRLVTATVKRAIADAEQYLRETNHSITAFLAAARPDPLTTDELVNELRPVPRMRPSSLDPALHKIFFFESLRLWLTPIVRMPLTRVYLRCRSPDGG